ncbi:MAG: hypothetical protein RI949_2201, partial [Pseudomonadota bacterium]
SEAGQALVWKVGVHRSVAVSSLFGEVQNKYRGVAGMFKGFLR